MTQVQPDATRSADEVVVESRMELFDAIRKRASYRGAFAGTPVPREHLEQIIDAGIRAPSGYNGQSTSFVVVTDPERRRAVASIAGGQQSLATAQAIIAVVMNPNATSTREFSFAVEDYAAATQNMLLAITALGYASVWIDGALRRNDVAKEVGDYLGVPADREVRVLLPVGVPASEPTQAGRHAFGERAWFDSHGGA